MDYLNSDQNFEYMVQPELSNLQLNTVKYVIETVTRFMNLDLQESGIKNKIIIELSKNYDVANDRFISFYENIFDDLYDNLDEESNANPKKIQK